MENLDEERKINSLSLMNKAEEEKKEADDLEQALSILKQLLYEKQLEDIQIIYEKAYTFQASTKQKQLNKLCSLVYFKFSKIYQTIYFFYKLAQKIQLSDLPKLQQFAESFAKFKQLSLLNTFSFKIEDDQQSEFLPFEASKLLDSKEAIIQREKNEIMVIVFWDSEDSISLELLDYLDMLFNKNYPEFSQDVRLIGVNLDEPEIAKKITRLVLFYFNTKRQKKWVKIETYQLPEDSEVYDTYQLDELPHVFVVDSQNKLAFNSPAIVDESEELIQTIIQCFSSIQNFGEEISNSQFQELLSTCQNKLPVDQLYGIKSQIDFKLEFVEQMNFNSAGKLLGIKYIARKLQIQMREGEFDKIKQFINEITGIIPKNQWQNYLLKLIKTARIEFNSNSCQSCAKEFRRDDFVYYCHFCKLWFCEICGDKINLNLQGSAKLVHPHNMVLMRYLNKEQILEIDKYRFGEGTTYDSDIHKQHFTCNGCYGKNLNPKIRWVCMNCFEGAFKIDGFIDLCDVCMQVLRNVQLKSEEINRNQLSEYKQIRESLNQIEHDEAKHIWLRVFFNDENYFRF